MYRLPPRASKRSPSRRLAFLAFALVGLLPSLALAQFGAPKAKLQTALDRTSYLPGETARLVAVVITDDGWHLQSNTPSMEFLIPTELTVNTPEGWPAATVAYPPDKLATYQGEQLAGLMARP